MCDNALMILLSCTMFIHLGLVDAMLGVFKIKRLPIVTCPKCLTFWCCVLYGIVARESVVTLVTVSFIASYMAVWIDLLLGCLDVLYEKVYKEINDEEHAFVHDKDDERERKGEDDTLPQL